MAATYTVTKTADTADGTCDSDCSLREAVMAANTSTEADTITIPAGTYSLTIAGTGENLSAQGDLDFIDSATTTITGAGAGTTVIDANGSDRGLHIMNSANVAITNLTISGGAVSDDVGAGIYCGFGGLTLTHVTLTGNTATGSSTGGGLAVAAGCSTTISASTISDNTAPSGGGIYYTTSTSSTNTITDVTFSDNTASDDAGGGIYVSGAEGDTAVTMNRVIFTGNNAVNGGGIFTIAPVNITNATFYNNSADTGSGVGGGLYANPFDHSLVSIAFSTFVHNSAAAGTAIYYDGVNQDIHIHGSVLTDNGGYEECYNSLYSTDYNYLSSALDCTINTQAHDQLDALVLTYSAPADHGGVIDTLSFSDSAVRDVVPATDCTDATGAVLTTDARGMTRSQGSGCDLGAYELDQTSPVVTPVTATDTVECTSGNWTDAGATVTDNFSSGLTASRTSGSVDVNTVGSYPIVYLSTTDSDNNTGTATRTVTVEDTTAPIITRLGEATVTVDYNSTYTDAGATVSDGCDQAVELTTDNPVDTTTPGDYTVTYNAEDASGNPAVAITRTVTVLPVPTPDRVTKTDITLRNRGDNKIIRWLAQEDATYYRFRIITKANRVILQKNHLAKHSYTLTADWIENHLVPTKRYFIEVKACNEDSCSVWSKPKALTNLF